MTHRIREQARSHRGISVVAGFPVCKSIQRSEIKTTTCLPAITALASEALLARIDFNTAFVIPFL
jgi:hypothetical protein